MAAPKLQSNKRVTCLFIIRRAFYHSADGTFRSLGSLLPAARHAQLHSTGSGPTPATVGDLGTLGRLKVADALLYLPTMPTSCPLPMLIAAGAAGAPWPLLWLCLGPIFRCSTWLLPSKGEAARMTPHARQLRTSFSPWVPPESQVGRWS